MGATLVTLSNILKEYYMGPIVEQLNKEVFLLTRLESKSEDLVGKRAYVPLQATRTGGIGARAENADLPAAGNLSYEKAVYDLKYLYGKVNVSGPSMAKTKSEAGAFLQALKSELDMLRVDLRKDLARQVYGDGTGTIAAITAISAKAATVSGVTAAAGDCIITLKSNATSGYEAGEGSQAINKGQLYVGMVITLKDSAGASVTNGISIPITGVFPDAAAGVHLITVTTATAPTYASGQVIVRAGVNKYTSQEALASGNPGTYSLSDEIDGLKRIVSSTASLGGIAATGSTSWWASQDVPLEATTATNGVRVISFDDIQKALNKVRVAGGTPTAIVTSLGVQREIYGLFQTQGVYQENVQTPDYSAGFRTLTYAGLPIVADIDAPYGTMYILDESSLKVFSDQDFHFLDTDGQTLRQAGNTDAFEAVMVRYMNMGAVRRNNQAVLNNIAVDGPGGFDKGF
jgi:hypothetical protein